MGKKAVFFDIDGTLFDLKYRVPKSAIEAIHKLRENGIYAFISTGRSRAFISEKDILNIGFDGVSAACGTYITYQDKVILEKLLDKDDILKTLKVLDDNKVFAVLEGSEYLYFDREKYKDQNRMGKVFEEQFLDGKILPVTGNEENCIINKMTLHLNGDKDFDRVINMLGDTYDYVYHKPNYMELLPPGFNKGTGIKYVCDYLGIDLEDTYAFGDSSNDLDMFKTVKYSVCMGNGTDEAKKAAGYITDRLENDGILKGLKYYDLI